MRSHAQVNHEAAPTASHPRRPAETPVRKADIHEPALAPGALRKGQPRIGDWPGPAFAWTRFTAAARRGPPPGQGRPACESQHCVMLAVPAGEPHEPAQKVTLEARPPAGRYWWPGRQQVPLIAGLPRILKTFPGGAMTDPIAPNHVPAGATPEGDGVVIGDGPIRVDAFIDFLCPFCRRFELSSEPTLAGLAAAGLVNLAYHPMNFLDQASTTNYSTRAAAASGCAADRGRFVEYAHALFVNQPPEGGPGLSDAELAGIGRAVGLADAAFAVCVSDAPYLDWPPYVTARAIALGVSATPTVLVEGAVVRPDPRAITAAVNGANGEH